MMDDMVSSDHQRDDVTSQATQGGAIVNLFTNVANKIGKDIQDGVAKFTNKYYGRPVEEYSKIIEELFQGCYFIEDWINDIELNKEKTKCLKPNDNWKTYKEKLEQLSFLLFEVIVTMVLEDLKYLIQRYLEKMLGAFTENHQKQ